MTLFIGDREPEARPVTEGGAALACFAALVAVAVVGWVAWLIWCAVLAQGGTWRWSW